MACEIKILWFVVSMICMVVNHGPMLVYGEPQVPCYFIFGDSLFDNGNNNDLVTSAKVNFPPYGIDFPGGRATGRFSNGRNVADFMAELLGFEEYIPPYASAKGVDIIKGVNYGSGGAGILDETGQQLGGRISLNKQLRNHRTTISRIAVFLGGKRSAKEYLSKCMYTVGMGNNDYINNYLMPKYYISGRIYTPEQYATLLIRQYTRQITTLYKYGARKVALFGVGLVGCTLAEIATFGTNGSLCVDFINDYVQLFNLKLESLVDDLNDYLTDAQFIYVNSTQLGLGDPSPLGITILNAPCCEVSANWGKGQCISGTVACSNRTAYAFWDGFHPTENVNKITAQRAYNALTPLDTYPMDISQLAKLDITRGNQYM